MAATAEDERWMSEALAVADEGLAAGELPIGAVVVAGGRVVGRAHTEETTQGRLLVHAELLALDQADRVLGPDRPAAVLYTTLEPCLLCLGAAATTMVGRIVFALDAPGDGAAALARRWDEGRTDDLPHVRLPATIGGVLAEGSRTRFRRYLADRPTTTDPLTTWVRTLLP